MGEPVGVRGRTPAAVTLAVGTSVEVEVPATSANLGPGFDCFGLALDWRDRCRLEVTTEPDRAEVTGQGAGSLPSDGSHLVLASARLALAALGVEVPGLLLRAHNTIPHGRGLGSSSAAIAAGLIGAAGLASVGTGDPVDPSDWLELATEIEGHPDNVSAALLGGFVLAYQPQIADGAVSTTGSARVAAVRSPVHPDIRALVFVPEQPLSTETARGLLPSSVPHRDAAANSGRSALLVHALADDPSLLWEATVDRLHQDYRADAMPASSELLRSLRSKGFPAVISGAGPTVLVLGPGELLQAARPFAPSGFVASEHLIGPGVQLVG